MPISETTFTSGKAHAQSQLSAENEKKFFYRKDIMNATWLLMQLLFAITAQPTISEHFIEGVTYSSHEGHGPRIPPLQAAKIVNKGIGWLPHEILVPLVQLLHYSVSHLRIFV